MGESDAPARATRFAEIYRTNEWGSAETRSGRGSERSATGRAAVILDAAIALTGARSLLDAGCGARNWLSAVRMPVDRYLGVDIVAELADAATPGPELPPGWPRAEMLRADIVSDPLPACDLVLCRDVLPHFSTADIRAALRNFVRCGARHLLTTSFPGRANREIETGLWRPIDLEAAPFRLPPPRKRWSEECPLDGGAWADKSLLLWRLQDLAAT